MLPPGKFDETYFIYPKNIDGAGYVLNYETRSFGRLPSENLLTKVEFYPVDYNYLINYSARGELKRVTNNLKIIEIKKYGVWAYRVNTQNTGFVELNQAYDNGWVAFQIDGSKLRMLSHIKINSWANGWLVPESSQSSVSSSTVYLIYWPQLLEWAGGVVGLVTLLFLAIKTNQRQ